MMGVLQRCAEIVITRHNASEASIGAMYAVQRTETMCHNCKSDMAG
jgi:hypothetical protein